MAADAGRRLIACRIRTAHLSRKDPRQGTRRSCLTCRERWGTIWHAAVTWTLAWRRWTGGAVCCPLRWCCRLALWWIAVSRHGASAGDWPALRQSLVWVALMAGCCTGGGLAASLLGCTPPRPNGCAIIRRPDSAHPGHPFDPSCTRPRILRSVALARVDALDQTAGAAAENLGSLA